MKTREKIVRQSIARIKKKIDGLNLIINANPLKRLNEIRHEAQQLIAKNQTLEQQKKLDFIENIGRLDKLVKEQYSILEKQKNLVKLLNKKSVLSLELDELNKELYYIEKDKK